MPRDSQPLRIAIDTGGTFTDCVWIDPATCRLGMLKVFSTPADPSQAIVEAVHRIQSSIGAKILPAGQLILLHGTTVGTNTLLERKGARTALVTTTGFEDVIEIGRQARPKLYDFFFDRVDPLVPSNLRFGVNERTSAAGEILTRPNPQDLQSLVEKLAAAGPQSIAVVLLFSYANSENEQTLAEALKPLAVPLSVSHQILPEFREYERTSTIVVNAYLQPIMQRYLENLESRASTSVEHKHFSTNTATERPKGRNVIDAETTRISLEAPRDSLALSGVEGALKAGSKKEALAPAQASIFVMQSSGGITSLASAAREPVRTVLSGPAGGVVGAVATARASGFDRIIAFDMGGTSTDVSLVEGKTKTANDAQVAGLPVGVPMLDIHTVGAGGGSLARFDDAGVLRVGPESAGADPGPICYGRGMQPTVTDANLLLGRLQPSRFLGGDFTLDLDRTRRLTREWLKKNNSTLTLEKFAAGVIRVVNSTMEKAIRIVSVERGRDPRHFALVAFGGAGGLHACALADALSIPRVIVPALPGALSALGILASDVVKDYSRTVLWNVSENTPQAQLNREFSSLKKTAAKDFLNEGWQGSPQFHRSADLRYRGQGYELNIPLTKNLVRDFEREYLRRYGYTHPNREIEIVTLRLRAVLKSSNAPVGAHAFVRPGRGKLGSTSPPETQVLFEGNRLRTKICAREELNPGKEYSGPAIITEYSATTVIPPGRHFRLDSAANLIVNTR